jgi:peptidoglycan-N-acetylglucosamine deacetylase
VRQPLAALQLLIHTAELLAEEGFLYDSSLMGDDVPYLLSTPKGELVELPVSWATDDWRPTSI